MLDRDRELDVFLNSQLNAVHWLDHLGRDLLAAGGKRLRAKLALKLGEFFGVPLETVLPWAAANEMLHNASLIHDDIQDQDLWRRGKPTLWSEHGTETAISVGDYLLMKPFLIVGQMKVSEKIRFQLQQWIAETVSRMAIAQVAERELLSRILDPDIQLRYLKVVEGKTSSLFELPIQGISLLAGQNDSARHQACACFSLLGQYFQIMDDLKDVFCQKGKPSAGQDLREGKVSAPIACYMALKPESARDLHAFLVSLPSEKTEEQINHWLNQFELSGAVEKAVAWANMLWRLFENSLPQELSNLEFLEMLQLWLRSKSTNGYEVEHV